MWKPQRAAARVARGQRHDRQRLRRARRRRRGRGARSRFRRTRPARGRRPSPLTVAPLPRPSSARCRFGADGPTRPSACRRQRPVGAVRAAGRRLRPLARGARRVARRSLREPLPRRERALADLRRGLLRQRRPPDRRHSRCRPASTTPTTRAGQDPNSEHPQLVKLIIAGAIDLFGDGPFAWRIGSLIFGTIAILGMFALACAAGAEPLGRAARGDADGCRQPDARRRADRHARHLRRRVHGLGRRRCICGTGRSPPGSSSASARPPRRSPRTCCSCSGSSSCSVTAARSLREAGAALAACAAVGGRDLPRAARPLRPHRAAVRPADRRDDPRRPDRPHRAHPELRGRTDEPARPDRDRLLPVGLAGRPQADPLPERHRHGRQVDAPRRCTSSASSARRSCCSG